MQGLRLLTGAQLCSVVPTCYPVHDVCVCRWLFGLIWHSYIGADLTETAGGCLVGGLNCRRSHVWAVDTFLTAVGWYLDHL